MINMLEKKLLSILSDMDSNLKGFFVEDYEEQVGQEHNYTTEEYIGKLIEEIPNMKEETTEENIFLYDWLEKELNKLRNKGVC